MIYVVAVGDEILLARCRPENLRAEIIRFAGPDALKDDAIASYRRTRKGILRATHGPHARGERLVSEEYVPGRVLERLTDLDRFAKTIILALLANDSGQPS
jgi:hypothetical protein